MGISIKHDEYERAIRQLATERGLSLTDAIGIAVRNELKREGTPVRFESYLHQIREAQTIIATMPVLDPRTPDEILGYDEHGLPT
ncbi:type II toxin-antitoxin system VapB family antitoxin [Sphingomonas sp.]|uniref:type II toxin-antitoxin system VapB family antitoxin n=1 Tax=Sphingomonas sp. TaxID=28214 RepID=UPI003B008F0F